MHLIWVGGEAKYFCFRGLTRFLKIRSDLPVGHNQLDPVQANSKFAANGGMLPRGLASGASRLWSPDQSAIMRLHRLVALASWLSQAFDVRNLNIYPIAPHWSWP